MGLFGKKQETKPEVKKVETIEEVEEYAEEDGEQTETTEDMPEEEVVPQTSKPKLPPFRKPEIEKKDFYTALAELINTYSDDLDIDQIIATISVMESDLLVIKCQNAK